MAAKDRGMYEVCQISMESHDCVQISATLLSRAISVRDYLVMDPKLDQIQKLIQIQNLIQSDPKLDPARSKN